MSEKTEFKGTKGEWEYSDDNAWECEVLLPEKSRQHIKLENTHQVDGFEEMYYNAKLIAASPDILEALQMCEEHIQDQPLLRIFVREAIKKALG